MLFAKLLIGFFVKIPNMLSEPTTYAIYMDLDNSGMMLTLTFDGFIIKEF